LQVPQNSNVVRDQIICFPRLAREGEESVLFGRVEIWDKEKEEAIVFLSNLLAFGATTIAAIYKDRWKVELFFKALKQLCKIKTLVWTALIAMLVLKYLQLKSTFSWSLSTLAALLRQQLLLCAGANGWCGTQPFRYSKTELRHGLYFLATALLTLSLDLCCPAFELFCAGGVTTIAGDLGLARTGLFAKLTAIFLSGWWYTNTG
jgi:hypothetical protein